VAAKPPGDSDDVLLRLQRLEEKTSVLEKKNTVLEKHHVVMLQNTLAQVADMDGTKDRMLAWMIVNWPTTATTIPLQLDWSTLQYVLPKASAAGLALHKAAFVAVRGSGSSRRALSIMEAAYDPLFTAKGARNAANHDTHPTLL
jgi:hypothetical protein